MARPATGNESFKAQIVRLRRDSPDMTYREIAARVGCAHATVRYYCSTEGVAKNPTPNQWKEKYFVLRDAHPDWTIPQIAAELGTRSSTLYGLKKRSDPGYTSIFTLGRAAKRAGLTIQQIEAMADARHA